MCKRIDNGDTRKKISPRLRYAIYLRDRCRCIYCGQAVIPGIHHSVDTAAANLEHVRAWTHQAVGANEDAAALMTSCAACNLSKKATPLKTWAASKGLDLSEIRKEIRRRKARKIDLAKAARWLKSLRAETAE
jgi:predicted molibdopterin-dependent oxidoreductase YjgC